MTNGVDVNQKAPGGKLRQLLALICLAEQGWAVFMGGGELLHVDMFAHNKSGIAYRDGNRRSKLMLLLALTVVIYLYRCARRNIFFTWQ
jgi:hypothetical protein